MDKKLLVSPSPHVTKNYSTNILMYAIIAALIPTAVAGVITFGMNALYLILISVGSAYIMESLFKLITAKKFVWYDISSVVTGLVMALVLPVNAPLYYPVIGNFIALIIFKGLFGGIGRNIFNPAGAGRAMLGLIFSGLSLSLFVGGALGDNVGSPLSYFMVGDYSSITISSMFYGTAHGAIGTSCILCILICGLFLMFFGVTNYTIILSSIATFVATVWVGRGAIAIVPCLFTGSFIFVTFFMLVDPTSSPTTSWGKFIYGLLFGICAGLLRDFFVLGETSVFIALMFVNMVSPLLDKIFTPRPLGARRWK